MKVTFIATTHPHAHIYQKNSTSLKLQPPLLTNLKKEKGFFFCNYLPPIGQKNSA
jgi:hypothetical protein